MEQKNNDLPKKVRCGFIGQGWIGQNYADNFEERGYEVVRYALEEPYNKNKDEVATCDIVFIAVPTPTTPEGFNFGILKEVIKLVGKGKIAVIKSTVLPEVTRVLQDENPDVFVMHSPEFLTEATASYDAGNPSRNILGIPFNTQEFEEKAGEVMSVLPRAPYQLICSPEEASFIKYGGNCWFYFKVIFINMLYDLVNKDPFSRWEVIREAMSADSRIGSTHLDPVHKSGRGAGGHCFIKDFEAFTRMYADVMKKDTEGNNLLQQITNKNIKLLSESKKDLGLLSGVYGNRMENGTNESPILSPIEEKDLTGGEEKATEGKEEFKMTEGAKKYTDLLKIVELAGKTGKYLIGITILDPENKTGRTKDGKDLHHFTFMSEFPQDDRYGCLDEWAKLMLIGKQ